MKLQIVEISNEKAFLYSLGPDLKKCGNFIKQNYQNSLIQAELKAMFS